MAIGASENKPMITVTEKRKFNWLVLAMLLVVVAVGAYWLLT